MPSPTAARIHLLRATAVLAAACAAQAAQRLTIPAGAYVQLSDGSRRDITQLASQAFAANATSGSDAPTGAWCCAPVWNGRAGTNELWASVAGLGGAGNLLLSADDSCATSACSFPINAPAFVSLCPGTAGCAAPGGAGSNPLQFNGAAGTNTTSPAPGTVPVLAPSPVPKAAAQSPSPSPDAAPPVAASQGPSEDAGGGLTTNDTAAGGGTNMTAQAAAGGAAPRLDVVVLPPEAVQAASAAAAHGASVAYSWLVLTAVAAAAVMLALQAS